MSIILIKGKSVYKELVEEVFKKMSEKEAVAVSDSETGKILGIIKKRVVIQVNDEEENIDFEEVRRKIEEWKRIKVVKAVEEQVIGIEAEINLGEELNMLFRDYGREGTSILFLTVDR